MLTKCKLLCLLLFLCNHNNSSCVNNWSRKLHQHIFVMDSIINGHYVFCVKTEFLNDHSEIEEEIRFPLVFKQTLIFKKNKCVIRRILLPIRNKRIKTKNSGIVDVLEMNAYLIYSLRTYNGDILFGIDGTGSCIVGDCPEFSFLFSKDGVFLSKCFNRYGTNKRNFCRTEEVLKKFKVSATDFNASFQNGKKITYNK